ncbi:hypothetical protein AWH56_009015 [Anaerobacillus isosaccharinicus]|uniref:Uncharacterized protein n=1 Tax=Anaerobacillus isosaccharinicus TaxID=1532552 RepID=A0A1S2M8A4_9BACI|nr:hypothetical protein [Anaerobacillus isosaccharinicus]MBA5588892.1 hypothetical protein [Anaerobacillus isosaccharinicus]QOY37702.1 hypothetical protein AWH56_009015 [Anaerobacillus isosaccharinicus]
MNNLTFVESKNNQNGDCNMLNFEEYIKDDPYFIRDITISFGSMFYNIKSIVKLKDMSDDAVLNTAIKNWVHMCSNRGFIKDAIERGDKKEVRRLIRNTISTSGSGGGMISFFKFGKAIEVKTLDGRKLYPTENDLANRYIEMMMPEQKELEQALF